MFLQPAIIPDKCLLYEALFWATFQRLPMAWYDEDGLEFHEALEFDSYAIEPAELDYLDERECAAVGIPPDPRYAALIAHTATLEPDHYDRLLAADPQPRFRADLERGRREAIQYMRACQEWLPHYEAAIELPAAKVFVALREGQLSAAGTKLDELDPQKAAEELEGRDRDSSRAGDIPKQFWSLRGINWSASAASNDRDHYCWIRCDTQSVLSAFPAASLPVPGVRKIGGLYVVDESAANDHPQPERPRGRPSFPWDAFHLEVADLVVRQQLPAKKEAGIEQLQLWFERTLGLRPSRSAIGEKLKPYYDRFVR